MPRIKRRKSNTNIYHVMCRSLNREILFIDDGDYLRYLSLLKKAKANFDIKIYAYCLMTNHVHLIIKSSNSDFSEMMRWVNGSYALFFNTKHGRRGYVFADRFKSEPIEKIEYLWQCIRYIHQNPLKAGLCSSIDKYKFSSIHAYKKSTSNYMELVDTYAVLKNFGKENFVEWNKIKNQDLCMDISWKYFDDKEVQRLLFSILKVKNLKEYDELDSKQKTNAIFKLIKMHIPLRQISRVSGMYYNKLLKLKRGEKIKIANPTYEPMGVEES